MTEVGTSNTAVAGDIVLYDTQSGSERRRLRCRPVRFVTAWIYVEVPILLAK
jgi:hypothetical protein